LGGWGGLGGSGGLGGGGGGAGGGTVPDFGDSPRVGICPNGERQRVERGHRDHREVQHHRQALDGGETNPESGERTGSARDREELQVGRPHLRLTKRAIEFIR
jgi:hypothetical protein